MIEFQINRGAYMRNLLFRVIASLSVASAGATHAAETKPTIVLVHGAFADASSWNGVISRLEKDGYPVVAVANPLRSVATDADYVRRIVSSLKTSVVLVGHSYGGLVITDAAEGAPNVQSLVYVAAFAPVAGETAAGLSGKFPGSTLGPTLAPAVPLENGVKDLSIQQEKFHEQFAADVSESEAKLMAVTQRPITDFALNEPAKTSGWEDHPAWFIYGDADKNIPAKTLGWMAERAHSKGTVVVKGGSHVVMVSHPEQVAQLIEAAATQE
jgi:pimeloyl-ACP methyl ester carboxylesterase